jgi:hypothetical protein
MLKEGLENIGEGLLHACISRLLFTAEAIFQRDMQITKEVE